MNIATQIGIGLVAVGFILALSEHLWPRNARVVPGFVVELIATRGSKSTNYKPRVSFIAHDGSVHEFVRSYSSNPPGVSAGEHIMVAYDARSYKARILTFGQRFGFATILINVGLTMLVMTTSFKLGRYLVPHVYIQDHSKAEEYK